jgi:membrane-bound lytic murein transglycosylase B
VRYWRRHGAALERAAARYGVGPEILVAILGVETSYGEQLGGYLALDALTTLGFSYPKRAGFFQDELKSLLLLAREGSVDPLKARGSYAGALGKPQFIPSSYRDYAVDFDGDGRRDLWGSDADILGSVANYFVRHGWRPGEPIAVPVRFPGGPAQGVPVGLKLAGREPQVPNLTAAELRGLGAEIETDLAPDTGLALIRLDGPDGGCCDEYWAGLANFYAITRYNRSNLYAMAVYQLSREILARRDGGA